MRVLTGGPQRVDEVFPVRLGLGLLFLPAHP